MMSLNYAKEPRRKDKLPDWQSISAASFGMHPNPVIFLYFRKLVQHIRTEFPDHHQAQRCSCFFHGTAGFK